MKKSKAVTEGTQLNTQHLHLNKANCTVSDSSGGINICFFVKKKNGSSKKLIYWEFTYLGMQSDSW